MKKLVPVILIILCLAGVGGGFFLYSRIDHNAPVVVVSRDSSVQYHSGMTTAELLSGVTAVDDKSGDVTNTLYVEAVNATSDPNVVEVVYVASDKSKNTMRYTYQMLSDGSAIDYVPEANPQANASAGGVAGAADTFVSEQSADTSEESQSSEEVQEGEAAPAETDAGLSPEEIQLRQEAEDGIAQLIPEAPVIRLSKYYEEILHGTEMDLMWYITELTDDVDEKNALLEKMQIFSDVNIDVPGTYHVSYYTMDSNGHQSNLAILTVRVL